jgi:predicted O-methyltransferase YrrM
MGGKKYLAMNALDHIARRYNISLAGARSPIEIPDMDRIELAALFSDLGYKVGAEIGVERGFYSLELLRNNPGLRLYCVDYWTAYQGYREHVTQDKLDGLYADAAQRLEPYEAVLMRGKPSVERAKEFKDGSLDFVYIDANHDLPNVIADIAAWEPKVRVGGIVAGHDYCSRKGKGYSLHVIEAVNAWTQSYRIEPWFVIGRKDVHEGEKRDRPRSWMWVKA